MPDIRLLPPSVVNKIAAGEVIERPASVVKELLENALDAGATRIDVSIMQGGSELIRIVDNGCGIRAEQLSLAVTAHATSKLINADDLFHVGTLGFRGEALASIAEVSRLLLRSRTPDADAAAEIEIVGGQASPVSPCGAPVGTTIEVHNLFFNTPVRRKFLKGIQTEMGHVSEAFTRLALAHPQRHFTLRHNERTLHDLSPVERWSERIGALCGGEVADQLIPVESRDGDIRLSGYAANPSYSRGNNRMQFLFLNGRPIRDKALQHALGEAYRGLLLTGRFPVCFLNLELPFELVDVNVHPTKMEVRFLDSGRLYSQLLGTLRTKFLSTDLTHRLQVAGGVGDSNDPAAAHDEERAAQLRRELVDWAKGELLQQTSLVGQPTSLPLPLGEGRGEGNPSAGAPIPAFRPFSDRPLELVPLNRSWQALAPEETAPWERDLARFAEQSDAAFAPSGVVPSPHLPMLDFGISQAPGADALRLAGISARPMQAMQIHNRYVVAESEEGVIVIDQHALHERILYEQLREKILGGQLETQSLLVPEPVDLSPAESAAVLAKQELLGQIGLRVEPFGGSTVLVTGYPAMLATINPREVLLGVVENLLTGDKAPDRRDVLDELLHMIACKAAIKAGDKLTPQEITALVEQRHLARDTHHCPHGRPTALVFTREQLDKQFMRT